jgi:hypothetical protein
VPRLYPTKILELLRMAGFLCSFAHSVKLGLDGAQVKIWNWCGHRPLIASDMTYWYPIYLHGGTGGAVGPEIFQFTACTAVLHANPNSPGPALNA